jgi:hypothetical protein
VQPRSEKFWICTEATLTGIDFIFSRAENFWNLPANATQII